MSYILQKSKADKTVDAAMYVVLGLFALATLFPLYYVIVMSVTPFVEVLRNGGFVVFPGKLTFAAYREILSSPRIPQALQVSVTVTAIGTALNLLVTTLLAYPLSKRFVPGRNAILMALVFTMLFNGGLIPTYLVVRGIGLYDTIWAMIVPGMVSTFNLLVMKTYFENLPQELEEAAKVDGCGDVTTLYRIVLPISMPIMATLGLFYGVTHWNDYFKGIMYLTDKTLYPIQVVLRGMIQSPNVSQELQAINTMELAQLPPETVKMATVVVAIIPILIVYPFLQKYFVKGMLIGAVKG
ncbi:carbohydrate ABC transporter permease [Paenibacillus contaminans]|uniref:ABC transporter permease n=1 Tax=Paenibacillus contaminans TaxID=450362 RepID=A0A329MGN4_9BACL|nr:carbohydrate ABC transporter permease [Paenibacillus contaminans]RAV19004.1 ABC transporter permease [Paenibacillus contaminans]